MSSEIRRRSLPKYGVLRTDTLMGSAAAQQ